MSDLNAQQVQAVLKDKIPSNLVLAEHSELGHFYRHIPTNQLFASVTTKCGILDAPHLKKWAARMGVEHMTNMILSDPSLLHPSKIEIVQKAAILAHQGYFEEAGDIGTRGHGVVEAYLLDWMKNGRRPDDIRPYVVAANEEDSRIYAIARSAELFCKDFRVIPIASEMFVCSLKHKTAGTMDSLMMVFRETHKGDDTCENQMTFDNVPKQHDFLPLSKSHPNKMKCLNCGLAGEYEFAIVDWKSSNAIDKPEYAMQVAAYWQCLYEMTGLKAKRLYIVRLDKAKAKYEVRVLTNRVAAFKAFTHTAKVWEWLNNGSDKLVTAFPRERVSIYDSNLNLNLETVHEPRTDEAL